ncbi:hypothetical protein QOL99_00890 [Deinococcus sp. MIMF12]|uniref:Tyrosine specific protein phosphatases domain-containing protein n=1 Tax=Deinococcus rhizophilus TaxID=3049544 RepID=A0ABT7JCD1_9DEIO|nr:hypothetical protein [Deinococcus rhizophilus]MDL2342697.1 hypothetical protein [Deinococcus rhizophilus]
MIRLTVSGVHDLPDLTDVAAVVSLRDPQDRRPAELEALDAPVLELVFHDTDGDPLDHAPQEWHLARLERFLDGVRPPSLHVHCFAGISRSPALASFALAYLHPERSDPEVVRRVLEARPQALPNAHLLRLADGRLGRSLARAWRRQAQRY